MIKIAIRMILVGWLALTGTAAFANTNANQTLAVLNTIYQYLEIKSLSDLTEDEVKLMSPVWHVRMPDESSGELKSFSLKKLKSAKFSVPALAEFKITNLHFSHQRIAIARLDKLPNPQSAILMLFNEAESWKVVADLRTSQSCAIRADKYREHGQHARVISVLGKYYDAVQFQTPAMLDDVFHQDWYMKNHEGEAAVFEGVDTFKKRLTGRENNTYYHHREIADVQVMYDCLAFIRINGSRSGGHTFFAFYKQNDQWLITDKLWTTPLE